MRKITGPSFICWFLAITAVITHAEDDFFKKQLKHERVRNAYQKSKKQLELLFEVRHLQYPPTSIFLRVFKSGSQLQVWIMDSATGTYQHLTTYPICVVPGKPGPKRAEGDLQVPEGFYFINRFNPASRFHLSLGIDYPNKADLIASKSINPGGEIFIHGSCVSIGCIPIMDENIEELYTLAIETYSRGQHEIPVHIFPCEFNSPDCVLTLKDIKDPILQSFWENLKEGYQFFETQGKLPQISVDKNGKYLFK